jgi:hypothetical protein
MTAATPHLLARHGWSGPEGTFQAGELLEIGDAARVRELIDGGYVQTVNATEAKEIAEAAKTDLPGQ